MKKQKENNPGVIILAGGSSRRMGLDKAELKYEGKTFLQRIAAEVSGYNEKLLSLKAPSNDTRDAGGILQGFTPVYDHIPEAGPAGGLFSTLAECQSPYMFVVPCDMPLFSRQIFDVIEECAKADQWSYDAWISRTGDGRVHYLCGLYRKEVSSVLQRQIQKKEYRMRKLTEEICVRMVDIEEDALLMNVNTKEDYIRLVGNKPIL